MVCAWEEKWWKLRFKLKPSSWKFEIHQVSVESTLINSLSGSLALYFFSMFHIYFSKRSKESLKRLCLQTSCMHCQIITLPHSNTIYQGLPRGCAVVNIAGKATVIFAVKKLQYTNLLRPKL